MFNVNVDKPTKVLMVHWNQSKGAMCQPRPRLVADGYWREVKSLSEAANIAVDLELPLRLCEACEPWGFVGTAYA